MTIVLGGGGGRGKKWVGPFLPHPQNQVKAKYFYLCIISYVWYLSKDISNLFSSGHKQFECLTFTIVGGGGGKKWAGPFLPHPKNQVKAKYSKFCVISYIKYFSTYLKNRINRPLLTPSDHKNYLGLTNYCLRGGGEEMGRPVSSPLSEPSESKIFIVLCYQLYLVLI